VGSELPIIGRGQGRSLKSSPLTHAVNLTERHELDVPTSGQRVHKDNIAPKTC